MIAGKTLITESMCVEKRLAIIAASNHTMRCLTQAHHQRQRIATWVAFLGRWQLPLNVLIMKEIEAALFSPLRGCITSPWDAPYMTTLMSVRSHLFGMTLRGRQDYLSQLDREQQETDGVLRRSLWQLKALCRLCEFVELKLGLLLDENDDDAPDPLSGAGWLLHFRER